MGFLVSKLRALGNGIDPAADWASRSAGAIYAQNFNYADTAALQAAAYAVTAPTANVVLDATHGLSGKCCRINVLKDDTTSHGSWVDYLNGVDSTLYQKFFFQVVIWQDEWLNWPYESTGPSLSTPKILIIDRYNGSSNTGEVVLTVQNMRGFLTSYRLTTGGSFAGFFDTRNTPANTSNPAWQPAIDRGTPNPATTNAHYKQRYGPFNYGMSDPAFDTPIDEQAGFLDPDAVIGGVEVPRGTWFTVELLIDYPNDRVKIWAAPYGEVPVLIVDSDFTEGGGGEDGSAFINPRDINGYNGFHLLPYRTNGIAEANRPDTFLDYVEIIVSESPIDFPGSYPPLSDLAALAESMSSGQWTTFSMGNLTSAIFIAESAESIGGFASRMLWDSLHKKIQFAGTSHTGGANIAGAGGLATWDDATNQWTRETYTWSSENPGHGYYHGTLDGNGNYYFRSFNSTTIYKRTYGQTGQASWQTGQVANIGGDYANQVAGALEWFPELNGGSGGLVFCDTLGANWTNSALSSWSTQTGDSTSGSYDNNIARAGGFIYFGGGQGNTSMYRLSPTGTVTSQPAFPFAPGQNAEAGAGLLYAHPNGNHLILIENADNGDIRLFDGSSWSDIGSHQITGGLYKLGCTIPEYGVMLFLSIDDAGTGTPTAKVFKP